MGLEEEAFMKDMIEGYLGTELTQCQVFFRTLQMRKLRSPLITTVSPGTQHGA